MPRVPFDERGGQSPPKKRYLGGRSHLPIAIFTRKTQKKTGIKSCPFYVGDFYTGIFLFQVIVFTAVWDCPVGKCLGLEILSEVG